MVCMLVLGLVGASASWAPAALRAVLSAQSSWRELLSPGEPGVCMLVCGLIGASAGRAAAALRAVLSAQCSWQELLSPGESQAVAFH